MLDASCDRHAAAHRSRDDVTQRSRDAIAAMVRAWRRERALRAAARALAAMDDHTLRDIGVARGDITAFVRRGRDEG